MTEHAESTNSTVSDVPISLPLGIWNIRTNVEVNGDALPLQGVDKILKDELRWLHSQPSSQAWRQLTERLQQVAELEKEMQVIRDAQQYLDYIAEKEDVMRSISKKKTMGIGLAANVLLEDAINRLVAEVVDEHLLEIRYAARNLSGWISEALLPPVGPERRAFEESGRLKLVEGMVQDFAFNRSRVWSKRPSHLEEVEERITRIRLEPPLYELSLGNEHGVMDIHSLEKIVKREQSLTGGMHLSKAPADQGFGNKEFIVTCVEITIRSGADAYLLLTGSRKGAVRLYALDRKSRLPVLLGGSSNNDKRDRTAIVQLRFAPATSSARALSLSSSGQVVMWNFAKLLSLGSGRTESLPNSGFFCSLRPQFHDDTAIEQLFVISAVDLQLPAFTTVAHVPSMFGRRVRQDVHVTSICFHPTQSSAGEHWCCLLATNTGLIHKFNGDLLCKLKEPVSIPRAFVEHEYVSAMNNPSSLLFKPGAVRGDGNMVTRELLRFHRSPVLLLDTVRVIDDNNGSEQEQVISIDSNGYVALWEYTEKHLQGMGWFAPSFTARIAQRKEFIEFSDEPFQSCDEPDLDSELYLERVSLEEGYRIVEFYRTADDDVVESAGHLNHQIAVKVFKRQRKLHVDRHISDSQWYCTETPLSKSSVNLIDAKLTADRSEVVCLFEERNPMILADGFAVHFVACLLVPLMVFTKPVVYIELVFGEEVKDFCCGPIMQETHSRLLFVLTSVRLMIYGANTAEVYDYGEMKYMSDLIEMYQPTTISVCPFQRLLFMHCERTPKKAKRSIILVQIRYQEQQPSEAEAQRDDGLDLLNILHVPPPLWLHKKTELARLSVAMQAQTTGEQAVLEEAVQGVPNQSVLPRPGEVDVIQQVIEHIIDLVMDNQFQQLARRNIMKEIYSTADTLGFVEPTMWPPERVSVWQRKKLQGQQCNAVVDVPDKTSALVRSPVDDDDHEELSDESDA